MTQLIVTPIDPTARGSYRQRSAVLRLVGTMKEAQESKDGLAAVQAMTDLEDIILKRLETDDGSPVEPLLDELSAEQFDQLLAGILGEPSVPNPKSAP